MSGTGRSKHRAMIVSQLHAFTQGLAIIIKDLGQQGGAEFEVIQEHDLRGALQQIMVRPAFDLIVTDLSIIDDCDALLLVRQAHQLNTGVQFIIGGDNESSVEIINKLRRDLRGSKIVRVNKPYRPEVVTRIMQEILDIPVYAQ